MHDGAAGRDDAQPRLVERGDDLRVVAQLIAQGEHSIRVERVVGRAGGSGNLVNERGP